MPKEAMSVEKNPQQGGWERCCSIVIGYSGLRKNKCKGPEACLTGSKNIKEYQVVTGE